MSEKLFTYEAFQSLIDSSYDGIHITDEKGITRFYNKACEDIEGIKKEDIIGKSVKVFVDSGIYPESITLEAIKQKKRVNMVQQINKKVVMASATPFYDKSKMIGIIVNSRDITSLNNLQDELEHTRSINQNYHMEIELMKYREIDSDFIARDTTMDKIIKLVMRVATVKSPVLIQGDSGVGKSAIAHLIHQHSPVKEMPFIKLDCGALTESLLEIELFGDERSINDAREIKKGLLELANGGTLFLNEIDELSFSLQSKLLSVIQDGKFTRMGGTKIVSVDIRVIAATHKALDQLVRHNQFKEELYYRLNVIPIHIPPLRERKDDIYPLIMKHLKYVNQKYDLNVRIDPKVMDVLVNYHWPGNVRELENIIERLTVTNPDSVIHYNHIPFEIKHSQIEPLSFIGSSSELSLADIMGKVEKQVLLNIMEEHSDVNSIAKRLKVNPTTIRRKLNRYKITLK